MDTFHPIPDFPDYFINKNGSVLSYKKSKEGILLKLGLRYDDYYQVGLINKDKKHKHMLVHRLLALTFIDNDNNFKCVDHIDRDKTNNKLENLRWASRELNNQNATRRKDNKQGHKNIYLWIDRRNNTEWYRFQIERNGKRHTKCFKTLADAIVYRNEYLTALGEEIID